MRFEQSVSHLRAEHCSHAGAPATAADYMLVGIQFTECCSLPQQVSLCAYRWFLSVSEILSLTFALT